MRGHVFIAWIAFFLFHVLSHEHVFLKNMVHINIVEELAHKRAYGYDIFSANVNEIKEFNSYFYEKEEGYFREALLINNAYPVTQKIRFSEIECETHRRKQICFHFHGLYYYLLKDNVKSFKHFEKSGSLVALQFLLDRTLNEQDIEVSYNILYALLRLDRYRVTKAELYRDYARKLSEIYIANGRAEQSINLYVYLLLYLPEDIWSHVALGDIYAQNGKLKAAYESYLSAWKINPQASIARRLGLISIKMGDSHQGESFLHKAVDLSPFEKDARLHLARLLRTSRNLEEAVLLLHQAIDIDPTFFPAILELALLYEQDLGLTLKGKQYYCQAVSISSQKERKILQNWSSVINYWSLADCVE